MKETYGAAFIDYFKGRTSTSRFHGSRKKIHQDLQQADDRITELVAQQKSFPARVSLAQARPSQDLVKLSSEQKHLTNVLKLVAYQIESDLVNLIRPHYVRTDEEGRTLIQTALQSTAAIHPTSNELRVTLSPLSSPHRSQAVAALCESLNKTATVFLAPLFACDSLWPVLPTDQADNSREGYVRSSEVRRGIFPALIRIR